MKTKKITLATFKSFVKRNRPNLYVKVKSTFDGMQDCVSSVKGEFAPAKPNKGGGVFRSNDIYKATLGIEGVWLVGGSRDYFTEYNEGNFVGIKAGNCCGSFIVAVQRIA